MDLVESARRLGHYAWFEERLFEVLGCWVQTVPEHDVKVHLATHGPRHAWHAELWRERFPSVGALDPEACVAPPNDALARLVDVLAAPGDGDGTVEKLAGTYRAVVPHLVAAYTHHQRTASPVADAPVLRSLGFVLADDVEAWREGELLLQRLLVSEEAAGRAAAHADRVRRLLVEAGGVAGPGTLG